MLLSGCKPERALGLVTNLKERWILISQARPGLKPGRCRMIFYYLI